MRCRTTWRLASERPNVSRCRTQPMVRSRQRCAVAYGCTAMLSRSTANCVMIARNPESSGPISRLVGTRTPSMTDLRRFGAQPAQLAQRVALLDALQSGPFVMPGGRHSKAHERNCHRRSLSYIYLCESARRWWWADSVVRVLGPSLEDCPDKVEVPTPDELRIFVRHR